MVDRELFVFLVQSPLNYLAREERIFGVILVDKSFPARTSKSRNDISFTKPSLHAISSSTPSPRDPPRPPRSRVSTIPVKRHGVDGVLVAVDDVDALPLGDVPHDDEVVVAGRQEDVFGRGMPLEVHDAASGSKTRG